MRYSNWNIGDIVRRNMDLGNREVYHALVMDYIYDKNFPTYTLLFLETGKIINVVPSVDPPHSWRKIA